MTPSASPVPVSLQWGGGESTGQGFRQLHLHPPAGRQTAGPEYSDPGPDDAEPRSPDLRCGEGDEQAVGPGQGGAGGAGHQAAEHHGQALLVSIQDYTHQDIMGFQPPNEN